MQMNTRAMEKYMFKVGIASDVESFIVKQKIIKNLSNRFIFIDLGVDSLSTINNYRDLASHAAHGIFNQTFACCVLISLTGNGLQSHANKFDYIRAGPCHSIEELLEAIDNYDINMCDVSSSLPLPMIEIIISTFIDRFFQKWL